MQRTILALGLAAASPIGGCAEVQSPQSSAAEQPADGAAGGGPAGVTDVAEYALRWPTKNTSIAAATQELKDVLSRLQRSSALIQALPKAKSYKVTYYDVAAKDWPEGYNASLRLRQEVGETKVDLNYKVRGPAPLPSPFPVVGACTGLETGQETDIAVAIESKNNKRNASINCGVEVAAGAPLPEAFKAAATPRPCKIAMTRYKLKDWPGKPQGAEDLKIEFWTFTPTEKETRALIEVSWKASIAPQDERIFRSVIAPLQENPSDQPQGKLQPTPPPGKEQTALACDANWAI